MHLLVSLLFLSIASVLWAQQIDPVPLQNWPAPLYWQAPAAEESLKATAVQPRLAAAYTAPLVFVGMTPCRVLDTRNAPGTFGGPAITGGTTRSFPIPSSACGVPPTALAYSFNVTVVPPGPPLWYLTIWPTGQAQPGVSTLNDNSGAILANAAVVPAGVGGSVDIFVTQTTNVLLDINGYYTPPTALTTLAPGTVAAPSLSFSGSPGSGIFSGAADTINIGTNGVNRLTIRPDGDVDLPGSIRKNGTLFLHNRGSWTVGVGWESLADNYGGKNAAIGEGSLRYNTSGSNNTAAGYMALWANTTGSYNTAVGESALYSNTAGGNTGLGRWALKANTVGQNNTATGDGALQSNLTGESNTATGRLAMWSNNSGHWNTAIGHSALLSNASGVANAAVGGNAGSNTTGSYNTLIGYNAGVNDTTGNHNIRIKNVGVAGESNTTRIGDANTTWTYIAGIYPVTPGYDAKTVMIDSNGLIGTFNSSRTVKRDIEDMGDTTATIMSLRPVRFRYTAHGPDSPEQYGLIAEEVAEVAPDLVVRKEGGGVETVHYQKVDAMLLNEVQKLHKQNQTDHQTLESTQQALQSAQQEISSLKSALAELLGQTRRDKQPEQ